MTINGDFAKIASYVTGTTASPPSPVTPPPATPPATTSCPTPGPAVLVYENGGFQNSFSGSYSWGTYNLASTAITGYIGTTELLLQLQSYSALQLRCVTGNCINTQANSGFTFWINGGANSGQVVRVKVRASDTEQSGAVTVTATANTWTQYVVSFASLAPGVQYLNVIQFQDNAGLTSPVAVYFDDVIIQPCGSTVAEAVQQPTAFFNNSIALGGPPVPQSSALSTGAIAGIVIGGLIAIVVVVIVIVIVVKKAHGQTEMI